MNPDASMPFPGLLFTLDESADWLLSLQRPVGVGSHITISKRAQYTKMQEDF